MFLEPGYRIMLTYSSVTLVEYAKYDAIRPRLVPIVKPLEWHAKLPVGVTILRNQDLECSSPINSE